jgi:glyceraldehyde 3-phosphate dehydrogenase
MATKIGINGFGRIGRLVLRSILERGLNDQYEVVGVNDLTDAATLAHLFRYDSVHGRYPGEVSVDDDSLVIDGHRFPVLSERDPSQLPWRDLGCEVVIESTGLFTARDKAALHLQAGARRVIISAPAKGKVDATVVIGVNDDQLTGGEEIVSNASCTTNCLAPMVKVLDDAFGIEQGFMTTIHAYTADQNIQDGPHRDLRRARAAAVNIIPTSTGAAKAVGEVLPHLDGKLDGFALRVPVPDGSLTDFTALLSREASVDAINEAFDDAAGGRMKGILSVANDLIVSSDIIHDPHSCIFDAASTMASGRLVKVIGWYDNEWGYACRTVDLIGLLVGQPQTA